MKFNTATDSFNRQIIHLTNEKANLLSALENLNTKHDSLQAKHVAVSKINRSIEELEQQVAHFTYENKILLAEIETLNKKSDAKILNLENENSDLKINLKVKDDYCNEIVLKSKLKIATSSFVVDDRILVIRQGDSYTLFTTELNKWILSDSSLNAINTAHESSYLQYWFERPISSSQNLTKPTVILATIVHIEVLDEADPNKKVNIIECSLDNLFE